MNLSFTRWHLSQVFTNAFTSLVMSGFQKNLEDTTISSCSPCSTDPWDDCTASRLKHHLYLLGFTISSPRNSCGGGFTTNCSDACSSALQNVRRNYGCCFNAYYNSTNPDSIATYALWDSCNVEVPAVCSNPFPEEPASRCPLDTPTRTPTPVTMSGFSSVTPAMKVVAGCVLSVLTLIRTNS